MTIGPFDSLDAPDTAQSLTPTWHQPDLRSLIFRDSASRRMCEEFGLSKLNTCQRESLMTMPRRTSNPPVAGSNPTDRTPKSRIGVEDLTTTKLVQHNRIQETTHQQLSAVEAPFSDIGGYLADSADS
jgi:hypothetical protein